MITQRSPSRLATAPQAHSTTDVAFASAPASVKLAAAGATQLALVHINGRGAPRLARRQLEDRHAAPRPHRPCVAIARVDRDRRTTRSQHPHLNLAPAGDWEVEELEWVSRVAQECEADGRATTRCRRERRMRWRRARWQRRPVCATAPSLVSLALNAQLWPVVAACAAVSA